MVSLLDKIDSPADLRRLAPSQLEELASEIRQVLVDTVMMTGGHLASNLGVVELTIALHRVFDSPTDKIVWDVGHQSYVHKLFTGRRQRFASLRSYEGISGFPEPSESPHDSFATGHASTSVSAAMGMAMARDLAGQNHHVVAVIGDGALTGGMALEALNWVGHLKTRLIVVLNDNAMSISPNVGAIARSLNRIRLNPQYHRMKEGAVNLVTRFSRGKWLLERVSRLKTGFKGLWLPTLMWEELGFTYVGPVDGHNIAELEQALSQSKEYPSRPTFIHVVTKKGKGYPPAEKDAVAYHGVAPSNGNGASPSSLPTYTKVFAEASLRLAREEPRLVFITAAMPEGTGLTLVAKEFPHRVFDVGICEQHAVTLAAGLASQGFRPVVAIYSTFLQRAYDQVLQDVCLQNLPVTFAVDRSGIVGDDGRTHQGSFDLSYLGSMPNMVVAAPKDENELRHLLYTAVHHPGPMAIRYPRGSGLGVPLDREWREVVVGRGEILSRGKDVAIVALGSTVAAAREAAAILEAMGVFPTLVNARFARPVDDALIIPLAQETGRLVTVEENVMSGGFGSRVLELLSRQGISGVRVECIGLPDIFVEHGSPHILRAKYNLDGQGIVRRILTAFPELAHSPVHR
ncbi:MAG: 1-deoxy-D-xylulose-5-phosphate synthase [Chloroflexi bacterium]|nr:1-deoxy-D-xylulose-5-phosphate synthase [Chloroflexota bacterium]